ncbi:hypothetical protein AB0368_32920 [Actinoplanes sp. NPDC051475]|uniref:hypothetical protein n=1 Tax=Actinoplanes sp. NPDC051475 TaxID=3157225 RepID=UPI00344C37F8
MTYPNQQPPRPGPPPGGFRPGPPPAQPPGQQAAQPPGHHAAQPPGHHAAQPPGHHAAQPPGHQAVQPPRVETTPGLLDGSEKTGHPAVDAVLQALANAATLAPADQIAEYEAAHQVLQETLASIDR